MKTRIKPENWDVIRVIPEIRGFSFGTPVINPFIVFALIAMLNLIPAGRATAQTFTTLHSFTALTPSFTNSDGTIRHTNSDGSHPLADLILSGNTLYGTSFSGGNSDAGTVFAVNTDGTGFSVLHNFTELSGGSVSGTNNDGAKPAGILLLSGNTLYGTATKGGSAGKGTVFALKKGGTDFTNLHSFTKLDPATGTNSDGANPSGGLVLSGGTLYGTANIGGGAGAGTVFALNTDGTGFTNLHSFTSLDPLGGTNSDGANPYAGLILTNNTLYGTASGGGSSGNGAVFAMNTDGSGFTNLHSFTGGSDGGIPYAGLILSGDSLYGTTSDGGISPSSSGTVFKVNTNGTAFSLLHSFTGYSGFGGTNSDGASPSGGLFLSGNTLYGTTYFGGVAGNGSVFAVRTNGAGFTNLHSFTLGTGGYVPVNSDGANPFAGLLLSGNTLFGVAQVGGSSSSGTIFSLSLPLPQLTIIPSGVPPSGIVLTWPISAPGFDYSGFILQSTTNLVSPVVWTTNSAAPVVVNGQNAVTNSISGAQKFYRLSQ
jgi:uncharacterized repeat protein (TIGR03803 family)